MKLRYIFAAAALLAALFSCDVSGVDDLEENWIYEEPTVAELSLSGYSATTKDDLTYYTLSFTSSTVNLHTVLVASSSFGYIAATGYTETTSSDPKNGYYISEDTYVTVGGSTKYISDGTITVTATATDDASTYTYTVSTVIFDSDSNCYKLSWEGDMTF